jgi:light-regulated signal transduction histidine kinase (bacteriophytochrome)
LLPTIQDSISNSEKTELYIELSKVFRKNNEIYKSKKFISLISNENKTDELSVLLEKAHINYEQNNLILAENELNQIIGHSDSIINTKKTIIDAHQLLSNICLKKENKTEAIDNLKKALGISNKNKFYEISKEITHDLLNILPTNDPYFNELNRSIIAFYENKNQINETELFYIKQLENLNLEEKKIIEVSNYNQIITILFIIFITSLIILLVRGYLVRKQLTIIETQNKKLENRNFEILKINHELASKNTKLEEYSKLIANDIKNSINIIKENSKMLNNDIHKSKFHIFNQIKKEGNKLNELINFILLNTIKNSDKKVPPEKINFEEIINEIQLSLKNSIDLLEPKFNFPETYPTFYGYKIHLYQILKNLIENALKYSQIEASPIITIIMSK